MTYMCFSVWFLVSVPQRMQLDIILTSLQDHTHVASLLGYSSPTDGPEVLASSLGFTTSPDPAYSATAGHPDTHLAEILMKMLLRNLGFYTVSAVDGRRCLSRVGVSHKNDVRMSKHKTSKVCLCCTGSGLWGVGEEQ